MEMTAVDVKGQRAKQNSWLNTTLFLQSYSILSQYLYQNSVLNSKYKEVRDLRESIFVHTDKAE